MSQRPSVRETTVERVIDQPPALLWPVLSDLDRWMGPGLRWRIDKAASKPEERLVARLWDGPGASSLVTIEIEATENGGSTVTVTEQQDRHFEIDATLSMQERSGSKFEPRDLSTNAQFGPRSLGSLMTTR